MNIIARVQTGPYDPHNVHIVPEKLFDDYNGDIVEYLMDSGEIQEEWVLMNVTITEGNTDD